MHLKSRSRIGQASSHFHSFISITCDEQHNDEHKLYNVTGGVDYFFRELLITVAELMRF